MSSMSSLVSSVHANSIGSLSTNACMLVWYMHLAVTCVVHACLVRARKPPYTRHRAQNCIVRQAHLLQLCDVALLAQHAAVCHRHLAPHAKGGRHRVAPPGCAWPYLGPCRKPRHAVHMRCTCTCICSAHAVHMHIRVRPQHVTQRSRRETVTREGRFWPRGGTSSPPCVGGADAWAAAAS